ncbi:MAG: hypothetical protein ABIF09_11970 [Gemmatimonadota bacterium]
MFILERIPFAFEFLLGAVALEAYFLVRLSAQLGKTKDCCEELKECCRQAKQAYGGVAKLYDWIDNVLREDLKKVPIKCGWGADPTWPPAPPGEFPVPE